MSLKLYSTCISVLQNFGFFFRPPPKLPKFAKFRRNFEPCLYSINFGTTVSSVITLTCYLYGLPSNAAPKITTFLSLQQPHFSNIPRVHSNFPPDYPLDNPRALSSHPLASILGRSSAWPFGGHINESRDS